MNTLGMSVTVRQTNKIPGEQSIVFCPVTHRHFKVTTVRNALVDKTFIVACSKDGHVRNWDETFTLMPGNHQETLDKLVSGEINSGMFSFLY